MSISLYLNPRLLPVLRNLLDNALRYSPADSPVELQLTIKGRYLCLRVRDAGSGLSSEQLEQAKQRFWSTASAERGSGFQVWPLCKRCVNAMAASCYYKPPPGWLRCHCRLPLLANSRYCTAMTILAFLYASAEPIA